MVRRRDSKGYTPLMLASFHGNVWLVRHLIDVVKINPNDPSQRTKEGVPQVEGPPTDLLTRIRLIAPTYNLSLRRR